MTRALRFRFWAYRRRITIPGDVDWLRHQPGAIQAEFR